MSNSKRSMPKSLWWSAGSVAVMIAGAVGPWATVADVTIRGTDGGRDGWLIIGAATVAVIALLLYARRRRTWLLAIPVLAGLAGAVTSAYDASDVNQLASDPLFGSAISTEWGIWVALVGSFSLALSAVVLLIEGRSSKPVGAELPSEA